MPTRPHENCAGERDGAAWGFCDWGEECGIVKSEKEAHAGAWKKGGRGAAQEGVN